MTEYEAAMISFQGATLATRYAALALTAIQCVILIVGIWLMYRAGAARDRQLDAAERRHTEAMQENDRAMKASAERHAEAMKALDRGTKADAKSHAEAMRALEALIERTAPKDKE